MNNYTKKAVFLPVSETVFVLIKTLKIIVESKKEAMEGESDYILSCLGKELGTTKIASPFLYRVLFSCN